MKRLTLKEFLDKVQLLRPEYDYSCISEYKNNTTPVEVICKQHGNFTTTPQKLLKESVRNVCPQCIKECSENRLGATYNSTSQFVDECKRLWPNRNYDFSLSEYSGAHSKIEVRCRKHGLFTCTAHRLISTEHVCKECIKELHIDMKFQQRVSKGMNFLCHNEQTLKSFGIHFTLQNVLDVIECNKTVRLGRIKIPLCCDNHGMFELSFEGIEKFIDKNESPCIMCRDKITSRQYSNEEFISYLKQIYPDKNYDYTNTIYKGWKEKVSIICPIHGKFWRLPQRLDEGRGCPYCKESLLERRLRLFFEEQGINFIFQYRNKLILGKKSLDFFLPDYSVGVECQGLQHLSLKSIYNKGRTSLETNFLYDKQKRDICAEHGIRVLYFTNLSGYNYFDKLITSEEELLKEIKNEQGLL